MKSIFYSSDIHRTVITQNIFGRIGKFQVLEDGRWKTKIVRPFLKDTRVPVEEILMRMYTQSLAEKPEVKKIQLQSGAPNPAWKQ